MSEKEAALQDAAVAIEALRRTNPINGDGSNYTLDQVLTALDRLAGSDSPSRAAQRERLRRRAEDEAHYFALEAENRLRRGGSA